MRILIFIFFAVAFFVNCGQQQSSKVEVKDVKAEEVDSPGKKLYAIHCQSCHMDDGAGVPDMNAPLISSDIIINDKEKLIEVILQGSAALTDASREWRNIMAGFPHLSDQEIADIATYVRNNFNNTGRAITVADVSRIRAQIK
jgi:mono/diheme cytochrome c family protein